MNVYMQDTAENFLKFKAITKDPVAAALVLIAHNLKSIEVKLEVSPFNLGDAIGHGIATGFQNTSVDIGPLSVDIANPVDVNTMDPHIGDD